MSNLKLVSSISNLLTCKISFKNKNIWNLGPKIPYLVIFGLQFNKNYYQIFYQPTHSKQKSKLGTKNALYLGLWLECWKTILSKIDKKLNNCHISNQCHPNCLITKFRVKIWILNLELKIPYLGVLGSNFEKPLSYLKFAPSILLIAKLVPKINILKFGTKNARFSYFGAGISKYYCHIWNQRPRIYLVAKFGAKIKILKSGSKNVWFGYFWTGSWKLYCHIWNQHPQCKNENP